MTTDAIFRTRPLSAAVRPLPSIGWATQKIGKKVAILYVLGFVNSVLACSDFRLLILIKYCCGYFEVRERKRGKDTTSWRRRRGELGGAVAARGEGKALMS